MVFVSYTVLHDSEVLRESHRIDINWMSLSKGQMNQCHPDAKSWCLPMPLTHFDYTYARENGGKSAAVSAGG